MTAPTKFKHRTFPLDKFTTNPSLAWLAYDHHGLVKLRYFYHSTILYLINVLLCQAYKALDQLYRVNFCQRKESFILSYLEPDMQWLHRGVKAPVSWSTL